MIWIFFGHESWCTGFPNLCPLSLVGQASHTVLCWQGTFCSVCGRSLLQDSAMCREVGRMACHRCLVANMTKWCLASKLAAFCGNHIAVLEPADQFDVFQDHKEISKIQGASQSNPRSPSSKPVRWWRLPGWVTFSVPFRREMISKKTWGMAARDSLSPSIEWLSDTTFSHAGPSYHKKSMKYSEVHTASLRHLQIQNLPERGGKWWPEIKHQELWFPSFPSTASDTPWQGITKCVEPWWLGPVGK